MRNFTVENENHCDFKKLRSLLIRTHMLDLINTTEDLHYENYRQQQMETRKYGEPKVKKLDNPKFKEEEEALRKRFTEQVKAEEARFRQWEQHVSPPIRPLLLPLILMHLCFFSSSPNATGSTRTSNPLTAPSSSSRLNLTPFRLDTAEGLRGVRFSLSHSFSLIPRYTHSAKGNGVLSTGFRARLVHFCFPPLTAIANVPLCFSPLHLAIYTISETYSPSLIGLHVSSTSSQRATTPPTVSAVNSLAAAFILELPLRSRRLSRY